MILALFRNQRRLSGLLLSAHCVFIPAHRAVEAPMAPVPPSPLYTSLPLRCWMEPESPLLLLPLRVPVA